MSSTLAPVTEKPSSGEIIHDLIVKGDLAKLSPEERARFYVAVCDSVQLNPLTKPFEYITLNGKLTLYATKAATDQLRRLHGVSIIGISREVMEGVLIVTATARDSTGREDTEIGAVTIAGLKGDALANAYMKAQTKAKRRVTLSLCGLGMLDESETETIPGAQRANIEPLSGLNVREIEPVAIADADDPRDRAMRKLHAVAKEHGWKHDDLHNLAYTEIGAESMQELGPDDIYRLLDVFVDTEAQALMDKRQSMRAARNLIEIIDNESGEVTTAPAPQPRQPILDTSLLDLENAIDGASSDADLLRIGQDMSAAKINDRAIWERFRAKRAAFAAVAR